MDRRGHYYLDTNIFIAIIEAARPLTQAQLDLVTAVDSGTLSAVTSEITLAECLVKPFSDKNVRLINTYLSFLDDRPNLPVVPISRQILLAAARHRSEHRVKLPDAIHVATAQNEGCGYFVTNDRNIRLPAKMKLLLWRELLN